MEKIVLSEKELLLLSEIYPTLKYNKDKNTISGKLKFDLTYSSRNETRIKDEYSIEILLYSPDGSYLPIVRETGDKIRKIAVRKKIDIKALHLNSANGKMCIIIPPKEQERYPNGFKLQEYLHHLEEHFYWISYFDRYEKKPWKDQNHSENGYLELFKENRHKYRQDVKLYFEKKYNATLSGRQFNSFVKKLIKKGNI